MLFEEMNRKTWEAYEKSRKLYNEHPKLYWLKLLFLLAQSFFVLSLILGMLTLLILWIIKEPFSKNIKIWLFLIVNAIVTVYIYFIILTSYPWKGMLYLKKRDYPELYRSINWVAHILKARKIHRIYLSSDFNAAVASTFTFVPGLRRNVLILGYPLLCAMSSKALLGCLAHEFGHLAGNHLSWSGIFFRLNAFWAAFQLGIFTWAFSFWRNRFLKSLNWTLHPVYYKQEIEADRHVVDKFGADYAADFLLQLELKKDILENDATIKQRILSEDFRTIDFAGAIWNLLQKPLERENCESGITKAMKYISPIFDEHPSFRERLAMTGIKDFTPHLMKEPDALKKLVGDSPKFFDSVNDYYRQNEKFYTEIRAQHDMNMQILENFDISADYTKEDCIKYLSALGNLLRKEELDAFLDRSCGRFPDTPDLKCLKLLNCLEKSEAEQYRSAIMAELEAIAIQNPMLIYLVNDTLLLYYLEHGENEKIKVFFDLRDGAIAKNNKKLNARLSEKDVLVPFPLNETQRQDMIVLFSKMKMIRCAYAVERRLDNLAIGMKYLVIRLRAFTLSNPAEIIAELQGVFPDYRPEIAKAEFCKKVLDEIPGACIYDRKKAKA